MAKKRPGPFDKNYKKKESAKKRVADLPRNDINSLIERRDLKATPPNFGSLPLVIEYQTHSKRKPTFQRDLTTLAAVYPHHQLLIQQLIHGAQLHFGTEKRAFQSYQSCHLGIEGFVEFLNGDEPLPRVPRTVAEIDFLTGALFESWLLRKHPGRSSNRKHFAGVRQAMSALQKRYSHDESIGTTTKWPAGPRTNEKVSEGYSGAFFNKLAEACLEDIQHVISTMSEFPVRLKKYVPLSDGDGVRVSYRKRDGLTSHKVVPIGFEESAWTAMATVAATNPKWPLYLPLEEAVHEYSQEQTMGNFDIRSARTRTINALQPVHFGPENKPMATGQLAYFAHKMLVSNSIYPFILWVQINTGWNIESVLALSFPLTNHIEDDLIDEHYCIIYSTKHRNQKTVNHRTNKKTPLGVYRVLRFVESIVAQHQESPHIFQGSLWQYITTKNVWPKIGVIANVYDVAAIVPLGRQFLARHKIASEMTAAKWPSIEAKRMRTTVQTKRREQGLSLHQTQALQGHADVDTGAIHYDDDEGSIELKNRGIRTIQGQLMKDVREYPVRLVQSVSLQELRDALESIRSTKSRKLAQERAAVQLDLKPQEVIHLLAPRGQTYIAACIDATNPTWLDHEMFLSPGDECRFFNRCSMCDKALIFKEMLPFVARRISDLNALRTLAQSLEWTVNYAEEIAGWEWILETWNNRLEVTQALEMCHSDEYVLPLMMRGSK